MATVIRDLARKRIQGHNPYSTNENEQHETLEVKYTDGLYTLAHTSGVGEHLRARNSSLINSGEFCGFVTALW